MDLAGTSSLEPGEEEERVEPMGRRVGSQPPTLLLHPQVTQLLKYWCRQFVLLLLESEGRACVHQLSGPGEMGGPEWT